MPRDNTKKPSESVTRSKDPKDYTFFWTTSHINGWASQWHPAPFTAEVVVSGPEAESLHFPTTEHWMMLQKALLFSDIESARRIMAVTETGKGAMTSVKRLGRKVTGFDERVWKENRERIVLEGSLHKYRQNADLRAKLLDTGDTTIAESSPRDRIWGIGFGEKNALGRTDKWGLNLLGVALGETRRILREEENATKASRS